MSETFHFPTAEEITRDWGERCEEFEPECPCCQMWGTYDMVKGLEAENADLLARAAEANSRGTEAFQLALFHQSRADTLSAENERLRKALLNELTAIEQDRRWAEGSDLMCLIWRSEAIAQVLEIKP